MSLQSAKKEALSLSPIEKIQLLDLVIQTLNKPDPEIEKKLIEESDKRYEAYKSGKVTAIVSEEVFKKYGL